MKKLVATLQLPLLVAQPVWAQVFGQAADMTLPVLHRYLARAITMQGLMDLRKAADSSAANRTRYEQQLAMLANLDARYIGRVSGRWAGETAFEANMAATRQTVADIWAAYRAKASPKCPSCRGRYSR